MQSENDDFNTFAEFINSYNECFCGKNVEKIKEFYDYQSNTLVYFDNHKNNDTYNVEKHIQLLIDFFKNGKKTESGDVEPLITENLNVFKRGKTACLCYISRYKSFPDPAVRCTLYLECIDEKWKVIHAHYSFQPDK